MNKLILFMLLIFAPFTANAALEGRLPTTPGGNDFQLYYDTVLDVTWFYDVASTVALGQDDDGYMKWSPAMSFARNLVFAGHSEWRLPRVTLDEGFNISTTDSELGYMYYVKDSSNIGNWYSPEISGPGLYIRTM